MSLEIRGLEKRFGDVRAVQGVDLSVRRGEFFTLLGPSGCGKTTILRVVAGIHPADAGRVRLNGADVTATPMHARNMALVFQSYALFPHLTVFDNVAFGLRMRKVPRADMRTRVAEALDLVRLGDLARRYPDQLSGGQQQRVSLARALVIRPDLLLLDEPLSNLDARLRDEMRTEIRDLHRRLGVTTVLVTHDIEEAFVMSDRIAVLRAGRVEQIGTPSELYLRPVNRFVAGFVGVANELEATAAEDRGEVVTFTTSGGLTVSVRADAVSAGRPGAGPRGDGEVGRRRETTWLVIRPESVRLFATPHEFENRYDARVDDLIYLGGVTRCRLVVGGTSIVAAVPSPVAAALKPGQTVSIGWSAAECAVSHGE